MIAISALDIERWADRLEARSELPRLVRKLVLGSNGNIRRIEMPAGEGVQRPGWTARWSFRATIPGFRRVSPSGRWVPERSLRRRPGLIMRSARTHLEALTRQWRLSSL